jgi:hypothetical protein
LETLGKFAFARCGYLITVNIGNQITTIDDYTFKHCAFLQKVIGGNKVIKIGREAFDGTRHLKDLPLLYDNKKVEDDNGNIIKKTITFGDNAFHGSRISISMHTDNKVFPTYNDEESIYTGIKYIPHCSRIVTKLS